MGQQDENHRENRKENRDVNNSQHPQAGESTSLAPSLRAGLSSRLRTGAQVFQRKYVGQPELLKELNRSRAFEILQSARIVSRPELAQQTGLSRATIAILMDDLLQAGIARQVGLGDSTGGRPPVLLEFNPRAAYALGAFMRDNEWALAATDLDGQVLQSLDVPIPLNTPEVAVDTLRMGVETIVGQMGSARMLPAIGLGTPGLVDVHSGVIKSAVDVGWFEVPIRQMVADALSMHVFVANRSKVGALAELWYGNREPVNVASPPPAQMPGEMSGEAQVPKAARSLRDLIYISIGTGIAAGIVHEGELYVGANSSAGEMGHVTILPDGPLCPCGNRGCLQQLASGPAITARARSRLRVRESAILNELVGDYPERLTPAMVFQAAEQGDSLALELVEESARYLGIAVANLVNLFNPELVVLGGTVGKAGQSLLAPLREEVRRRAMAYPLSAVEIITSELGNHSEAVGAAALVLQHASELIFDLETEPSNGSNPSPTR